jgi:hypothetical protein
VYFFPRASLAYLENGRIDQTVLLEIISPFTGGKVTKTSEKLKEFLGDQTWK